MSTSILYHGFGLRQVDHTKTTYAGGTMTFHLSPNEEAIRCPTCKSRDVGLRGSKDRRFRHLPIGRKRVDIVFTIPRVECRACGALRQIAFPFAQPYKRFTRAFERYVVDLCRSMTMQDVAKHVEVSWDTVKEIETRYLQRRFARPKLKRLRRIAIDEIAVGKGHRYLTVVLDLDSGAVVFVGNGKDANALKPFWKRLKSSRARIEAVALDMSPAYTAAVRDNLPQAVLVYDRFHVMKLFNHNLSQLRREQYSLMKDRTTRQVLKGVRWLLLKNPNNLNDEKDERKRLEEALQFNQVLATAYYLKESLREQFWNCQDYDHASRFLDEWLAEAKASGIRLIIGMALTLERHREGLLNYYRHSITTGPLEGTNNKIKTLKRQAYGYRDEEIFKLKIMAIHKTQYALTG